MKEELDNFSVERNGKVNEIVIRHVRKNDVADAMDFYNKVLLESDSLSRIKPIKKEDEEKWVKQMIENRKRKNGVCIFAEHDGRIVGSTNITKKSEETDRHVGVYGISILKNYWGLGIGKKLTENIVNIAKNYLKLEIVMLTFHADNKRAERLYKKSGFIYAGEIPRSVKRGKKYTGRIYLYKVLK